jgi:phosphoribosylformimino-5-aminoimidazole carboxamide ribotide isomerase
MTSCWKRSLPAGFAVVPAVDVLGAAAVRLERGDYDRVVTPEADPEELVERFARAGAPLVHVVDLDGARSGRIRPELVARLFERARPARVQASGGIRSPQDAEALLAAGAERVVVGTAAFADRGAPARYAAALGERLVVALDAREGRVAVSGWTRDVRLDAETAAERCAEAGVARLLCTAIERDGTLRGPDLELLRAVVERAGAPVLAAGGISSEQDLAAVAETGAEGAVVGRALLTGALPLDLLAPRSS